MSWLYGILGVAAFVVFQMVVYRMGYNDGHHDASMHAADQLRSVTRSFQVAQEPLRRAADRAIARSRSIIPDDATDDEIEAFMEAIDDV